LVFDGDFVVDWVVKRGGLRVAFLEAENIPLDLNFLVEISEWANG
jgi:hypothetical protein